MAGVTVGVAIAVPEPYGSMLRKARRSFGDELAEIVPTHITLLPPTLVEDTAMPLVLGHLEEVAAAIGPFDIALSGTDTFRPVTPVVFVSLVDGVEECTALAAQVCAGPLDRPLDFAYHPHVTVAHNLDESALDLAQCSLASVSLEFSVVELVLYAREGDGPWERMWAFRLTGDMTPSEDEPGDPVV